MEGPFPDGAHVRLRSRWHNQYLYADVDGDAVVLNNHGASLNAVWRVHREERDGISYVLFHGAAYDRYLSFVLREEHPHYPVPVQVQRIYGEPAQNDVLWQVVQVEDGTGDVLLLHQGYGVWRNLDLENNTSMWWIVEAVEADECFVDGTYVRLWSHWHNAYLCAAEDGSSIAGSTDGASLNVVWTVHRLDGYVLFYGASYGRYLSIELRQEENDPDAHVVNLVDVAAEQNDDPEQNDAAAEQNDDPEQNDDAAAEQSDDPEQNDDAAAEQSDDPEHNDAAAEQNDDPAAEQNDDPEQNDAAAEQNNPVLVIQFVQRAYGDPEQNDVLWLPLDEQDGTGDILLLHRVYGMLRNPDGTNMRWMIEEVLPRENPPDLPPLIPPPMVDGRNRRVAMAPPEFQRTIRYVRANHRGDINPNQWRTFRFNGRSVFLLRSELAGLLGEQDALNIRLCVRAGSQGRLTPLVVDLPADNMEMEIVVFSTGSQGAEEFVYPDVDAEEP